MGATERLLLAARLLEELSLPSLQAVRRFPGTARAVGRFLAEVAEGGLDREEREAAFAAWPALAEGCAAMTADLVTLHGAYEKACRTRGRLERGEAAVLASKVAQEWRRPVACYGFESFTPSQRVLLSALGRRTAVLLALPAAEEGSPFSGPTEADKWDVLATGVHRLGVQAHAFSSPSVAGLERRVAQGGDALAFRPEGEEGGFSGVRFLVAAGRRNEAELVAAEVVGLLRDGIAPEQIGILVRHVGPWREVIHRVFRSAGIPYRLDGEVPFGGTGLGFALLSGLRGIVGRDVRSLLAFLRSPFSGAPPKTVDRFERDLLRRPASDGAALFTLAEETFPEIVASVLTVTSPSPSDSDGTPSLDPGGLRALAQRHLLAAARGLTLTSTELEEDSRALGALERALAEWDRHAAALDAEEVGLPWESFLAALEQVPVRNGGEEAAGVVHVLSVHRARARRWQVVFLLGLVDGEFPGGAERPGLLTRGQRRAINRAAGRTVLQEEAAGEDRRLFAFALSRAWQLLYLSGRNAEDDGSDAVISPYFVDARLVLGDPPVWRSRDLGYVVDELGPAAPAELGRASRSEAAGRARPPSERAYLRACAIARRLPAGDLGRRLSALPAWQRRPHRFRHPIVLQELAGRDVFSPSQLEAYAQCPFGWFVDRVLRPQSLDRPFDALAQGRLSHDVLADVYTSLQEEGRLPLEPDEVDYATGLVDRHLQTRLEGLAGQGPAADRLLAGLEVRERVVTFLEAEAATGLRLTTREIEKVVGGRDGLDLGGLLISGRIDRVDAGREGGPVFVVDYKGGAKVAGPPFADKGALQVPLYLLALRVLLPERVVAGGAYVALGGEDRRGMVLEEYAALLGTWLTGRRRTVSAEELEADLAACLEAAKGAAEGIRQGLIGAEAAGGCPSYCRLGPLCRSKRGG